jgi:site-specific recombinase XerD
MERTAVYCGNCWCYLRDSECTGDVIGGNLKAVQKLLGHSSISTTGGIYTDWDIDQLAETLRGMLEEGER